LRAIALRLWWDRRALLAQFERERPVELFKTVVASRQICKFALFLCERDPNNWTLLASDAAMWDSTYMLFIHLLRQPRDIFIKVLRLITL
jgi:hypothetical protein